MRREGGDLAFLTSATSDSTIAAGIVSLEVLARFHDDALDATASLRSTRGDKADAKLAIGAVAGAAPGHIAPEAPLEFSVSGDIPSLQLLQPWIGTAAVVSGRLHVDIAARGTVARPALSGAVLGEGLRIDAPQYGLHYTNGRLAARAANDRIDIDDLTLGAGSGTFQATGEISGLAPGGAKPRREARVEGGTIPRVQSPEFAPRRRRRGHRRGRERPDHALRQASRRRRIDRLSGHAGLHPRRRRRRQRLDPSDARTGCASTICRSPSI